MRASNAPTSAGSPFTTSRSELIFGLALGGLICAFLAPALRRPLQDPDMWWLMWAGREGLPSQNLLSFTNPDHPWSCHEPAIAWAWGRWSWPGVAGARALVLGALAASLLGFARSHGAWAAVLALMLTLPGLSIAFSERAMAWGLLTLALTLALTLPGLRRPGPTSGLMGAAVVAAGSLVHGSYLVSAGVLLLWRPRWGVLAMLLCGLLPGGVERMELLLQYMTLSGGAGVAQSYVAEWRPVWESPLTADWLRGSLALLATGLAWPVAARRERLMLALISVMAMLSLRHLTLHAILVLPPLLRALDRLLPYRRHKGAWVSLPLLGLLALATTARPDPARYPTEILEQIPLGSRTYTDLKLGAWVGQSGRPVFWDARNDAYSEGVMREGITISKGGPAGAQLLARYRVDKVLSTSEVLLRSLEAQGWLPVAEKGELRLLGLPPAQSGATVPAAGE